MSNRGWFFFSFFFFLWTQCRAKRRPGAASGDQSQGVGVQERETPASRGPAPDADDAHHLLLLHALLPSPDDRQRGRRRGKSDPSRNATSALTQKRQVGIDLSFCLLQIEQQKKEKKTKQSSLQGNGLPPIIAYQVQLSQASGVPLPCGRTIYYR